ncbi:MAG: amidohydrolase family protein [Caldisphaeraceae archaeon]|nr:amidohydrolase family protein [Caldisphaeraceae archaeon]
MAIDFHLHIPEKWVKEDVPPRVAAERLISFIDDSGIEVGVILPIAPYVSNDYIHRVVSYEPKRLVGLASLIPNPADSAVRELKRAIEDLGLRGLKLHLEMQGFCIRHSHVVKVINAAGELNVPVVIHAMRGDLSLLYFRSAKEHVLPTPGRIEDYDLLPVLTPKTTINYVHMGGLFGFREFMAIVAGHPNVYLDTSYSLVTIAEEIGIERLSVYIKHLGADKFIFGSDHIIGLTRSGYQLRGR